MQKATLVLEGGATRGVFTAGVLDYLMEKDLYMSYVIGVSAGACNAVDYVSKQMGRTKNCMIPTDKNYTYFHGFRKFVRERSLMNMDLIFDAFPKQIYPFDFDTYFQSETECELVATNCVTGKPEYFNVRNDQEKLLKSCRASCSLPLLAPMVNIDGIPYLDGGLSDSVPIDRAFQKGNDKIVVVLTRNKGYRKSKAPRGLAEVYRRSYRSYPNLVRSILTRSIYYNQTMRKLELLEQQGKIFVIRPTVKPISRIERDTALLNMFFEHGYHLMEQEYEKLQAYLEQ